MVVGCGCRYNVGSVCDCSEAIERSLVRAMTVVSLLSVVKQVNLFQRNEPVEPSERIEHIKGIGCRNVDDIISEIINCEICTQIE